MIYLCILYYDISLFENNCYIMYIIFRYYRSHAAV